MYILINSDFKTQSCARTRFIFIYLLIYMKIKEDALPKNKGICRLFFNFALLYAFRKVVHFM